MTKQAADACRREMLVLSRLQQAEERDRGMLLTRAEMKTSNGHEGEGEARLAQFHASFNVLLCFVVA